MYLVFVSRAKRTAAALPKSPAFLTPSRCWTRSRVSQPSSRARPAGSCRARAHSACMTEHLIILVIYTHLKLNDDMHDMYKCDKLINNIFVYHKFAMSKC